MGCANSKASAGVDEPTKADAIKCPAEPAPKPVAVPAAVAAPSLREEKPVAVMEPEGEAAEAAPGTEAAPVKEDEALVKKAAEEKAAAEEQAAAAAAAALKEAEEKAAAEAAALKEAEEKAETEEIASAEAKAWEDMVVEERAAVKAAEEGQAAPEELPEVTTVGAELTNFLDDFMKWVAVIFSTGFFAKNESRPEEPVLALEEKKEQVEPEPEPDAQVEVPSVLYVDEAVARIVANATDEAAKPEEQVEVLTRL